MRSAHRPLAAGALLLTLAAALLLFLNHAKFASTLETRERARQMLLADDLARTLEAHLALGLALDDAPALRALLARGLEHDPRLLAAATLDTGGTPRVVAGTGSAALWLAARRHYGSTEGSPGHASRGGSAAIALPLHNGFGLAAGWLVLEYDLAGPRQQTARAFAELWPPALLTLALALAALALLAPRIARRAGEPARASRRLGLLVAALLLAVQCSVAWSAYHAFTRVGSEDAPLLAATLARTLTPELERALRHGIPLAELSGVGDWLQPMLDAHPEFASLAIADSGGRTLFRAPAAAAEAGDAEYRFPLQAQAEAPSAGTLVIGLDLRRQAERTRQLAMEFATLLVIGVLLSLELLYGLGARSGAALDQAALARLRLPLFLFFIGSELPRAFLPMWSRQLAAQPLPAAWDGTLAASLLAPFTALPMAVRMTLPISIFLLAVALVSPLAGRQSARHGPMRLLGTGLLLAAAGHALAFVAESLLTLSLARILAGASFGCISVAAFDYIGRAGGARARGMALYLAAYVAAGICGAGLGALMADRAGIPPVFGFGLICIALAAVTLRGLPALATGGGQAAPLAGSLLRLLRQPRFVRLIALIALPMQIVQQGLLFYWAPLALTALGEPTSFVGLAMMGYFLLVLLLNGPSARWADRSGRHLPLVLGGLALAGAAGLLSGVVYTPAAIAFAVALVGVAWASGFPAQGALVLRIGQHDLAGVAPAVAIGVYRMVERIGAMLAPLLVALLIGMLGYAGAAEAMGAVLLLCALAQGWISRREGRGDHA